MPRRRYSRRATLRALGLGAAGVAAVGTGGATASTPAMDGLRPDGRVQFVEADPDAGFNYPYWLATPASVRAAPVRLLVTMNSANPGQPFEGGGPDRPTTVRERARSQVASLDQVGAWVSERLGVPQLVPVFPMPDSTTRTTQLDRQSMLLEGTDLERVDRQLLRMTEHARSSVLDSSILRFTPCVRKVCSSALRCLRTDWESLSDGGHRVFERECTLVERTTDHDCGRARVLQGPDVLDRCDPAAGDYGDADGIDDAPDWFRADAFQLPLDVDVGKEDPASAQLLVAAGRVGGI